MQADSSVGGRVDGSHLDATDTFAFNSSDLDVALITPGCVPGVLNAPVIKTASFVGAVSNEEDAVVETGAACGGVQYTAGVCLEDTFVGLDGDRNWLLSDGGHQLRDAI